MTLPFSQQRINMVEGQLRPNKVNNRAVLHQFMQLPREEFTGEGPQAYLDQPVTLTPGRQMYDPMAEARLIQALAPSAGDTALVIAAGTGYSAGILHGLCHHVTAIEDDGKLVRKARQLFQEYQFRNIALIEGDILEGAPKNAPYNIILVDTACAVPMPQAWKSQLAENGRIAGVFYSAEGLAEACIFTKHGNSLVQEVLFETKAAPHPALCREEGFTF